MSSGCVCEWGVDGWMVDGKVFHWLCVSRQWLEDALKENDPTAVQLYLVGTKKDLSVSLLSCV